MSYTQEEARILIDFHRKYSTRKTNYYLHFLELLEEHSPDIQGDIEDGWKYDDPDYEGEEQAAREMAIGMVSDWIAVLEELRDRLKG